MNDLISFTSVGLAYDVIGVVVLGVAFFLKPISAIVHGGQTIVGANPEVIESGIKMKIDGITGTSLLVFGFVLQWLGSINYSNDCATKTLYVLLLVILISYFFFLRKIIFHYLDDKARKAFKRNEH